MSYFILLFVGLQASTTTVSSDPTVLTMGGAIPSVGILNYIKWGKVAELMNPTLSASLLWMSCDQLLQVPTVLTSLPLWVVP